MPKRSARQLRRSSNDGTGAFSDGPAIPQLTIAGELIGRSDIMMEMFDAGELEDLVTEKGLVKAG
jgi:monothiol glutaredoxin